MGDNAGADKHGRSISSFERVIFVQPSVPTYRVPFYSRLFDVLGNRLTVFASPGELNALSDRQPSAWESRLPPIRHLSAGLAWQPGAVSISLTGRDLLVISGAPRNLSNIVLMLRARLKGTAIVWWGHYRSSTSKRWRMAIRMALSRYADALLFYTDEEVNSYKASARTRLRRVCALGNGIDTIPISGLRTPYSATAREGLVLFIGRLTDKARLSLLIDALGKPECAGLRLAVIGEGQLDSGLRRQAASLGLDDRIEWHGALVDETGIAKIANRCRVFVYPGAVGLSLIHAMAYGLPAIVHDNRPGHMPEIAAFRHGVTGFSFEPDSVSNLAQSIVMAMSQPEILDRMSAQAINTVEQGYSTDGMARRFLAMMSNLDGPESARE